MIENCLRQYLYAYPKLITLFRDPSFPYFITLEEAILRRFFNHSSIWFSLSKHTAFAIPHPFELLNVRCLNLLSSLNVMPFTVIVRHHSWAFICASWCDEPMLFAWDFLIGFGICHYHFIVIMNETSFEPQGVLVLHLRFCANRESLEHSAHSQEPDNVLIAFSRSWPSRLVSCQRYPGNGAGIASVASLSWICHSKSEYSNKTVTASLQLRSQHVAYIVYHS